MPGGHWSLRRPHYSATLYGLLYVFCNIWNELERYLLHWQGMWCFKLYFMWSIGFHIQRNKRGQTSRPVVGAEIQTRCNITASPRAVIILFWLIGVSCGPMDFWNRRIVLTVAFVVMTLSLAISVFSYTKIYLKLRHQQLQAHVPQGQHNRGRISLNIARYKKSVSSVLWVQLALVTCYVPFIVLVVLSTFGQMSGNNFDIAFYFTVTLTFLNSSLNPILYCWRIGAVREAAKDTIKQLNCCKSAQIVHWVDLKSAAINTDRYSRLCFWNYAYLNKEKCLKYAL